MLCVECGDVCEQGEELCERCKEEKHSNHIEGSDSDGNDEADWF
jgi:predicted amidophosphoribosyltransferase